MFALDTPDTSLDAYWTTAAQILALLSLAVVVEARAVQRQWRSVPAWLHLVQGTLWFLMLGAAALLLPSALEASRPDRSHPSWMPELTQRVIMYSVAMLVLGPALIFLVMGMAEPYYIVKGFSPRVRWRMWLQHRSARKLAKKVEAQTRTLAELHEKGGAATERAEGKRQDIRRKIEASASELHEVPMSPEEVDRAMAQIEWLAIQDFEGGVLLRETEQHAALAEESIHGAPEMKEEITEMLANVEDMRRRFKSATRERSKAQAELLRSYFDPPESSSDASPKA